jgi:hypothetical protein
MPRFPSSRTGTTHEAHPVLRSGFDRNDER